MRKTPQFFGSQVNGARYSMLMIIRILLSLWPFFSNNRQAPKREEFTENRFRLSLALSTEYSEYLFHEYRFLTIQMILR